MRLVFVINDFEFFKSHRLAIALAAKEKGYEVHVVSGSVPDEALPSFRGLSIHPIPFDRSSQGLYSNIRLFWRLWRQLRLLRPDIIHLVTIKSVLFGGIAARFTRTSGVVAAIPGLGYIFTHDGFVGRARQKLVGCAYRLGLSHPNLEVIFQNPTDKSKIIEITGLQEDRTNLIHGSGVDLKHFVAAALPPEDERPIVLMASRLLRDKGVYEFVTAASILKNRHINARCVLVGRTDPGNPTTILDTELAKWHAEGPVEVWGFRSDLADVLPCAQIVVLPSYREGLPKVLLEAAATGRPVITTNVPGCRDAIEPGKTGVLVPQRDGHALADAIAALLADRKQREAFGAAGRALAERAFDVETVVSNHLEIYRRVASRI